MTMATRTAGNRRIATISATVASAWPNRYDAVVFLAVGALFVGMAHAAKSMHQPLAGLDLQPVSLDPRNLPQYALLTTLRMFAALGFSLLFTFLVAPLAAKSKKAERVIIPALDILQSVPVLGFLTFTVLFFMNLFPGSELGAELAAIFAIFTSQAWNMTFSFYQSLTTVPRDLEEASQAFQALALAALLEAGSALRNAGPRLEHDDVHVRRLVLRGGLRGDLGRRYQDHAAWHRLLYLAGHRPEEYRRRGLGGRRDGSRHPAVRSARFPPRRRLVGQVPRRACRRAGAAEILGARSYQAGTVSFRRSAISRAASCNSSAAMSATCRGRSRNRPRVSNAASRIFDWAWNIALLALTAWAGWSVISYVRATLGWSDFEEALMDGFLTFFRVVILIVVASLIWVPIGVYVGLRPALAERVQPVAQFLAAFPANVLFPFVVVGIATFHLDPDIWLSPLIVLGTQWYILFNVIAGASVFPSDLSETAKLYKVKRWQWWRKVILPGIFPYYVTGALTASGGSWNASIVAEVASWGDTKLEAHGLGAYIAKATSDGDFHRVVLGVGVMSRFRRRREPGALAPSLCAGRPASAHRLIGEEPMDAPAKPFAQPKRQRPSPLGFRRRMCGISISAARAATCSCSIMST